MIRIGIRQLKEPAPALLRRVREDGQTYEVTYRGQVIAHLVPVEQTVRREVDSSFWKEWETLAREIAEGWPEGVSAVDAVRDDRRGTSVT